MAETAVALVVEQFIPFLIRKGSLLTDVHSNFFEIQSELRSLQCFLKDADSKAEGEEDDTGRSDGAKVWVKELRELAFQIEDAIDDYIFYLSKHPRRHGLLGFLHKIGRAIQLKPRFDIASQIRDIKSKVREIKERSPRYGFGYMEPESIGRKEYCHCPNRLLDPFFVKEAQIVGNESDRDKLISWLVDDQSRDCRVVALVGMGGVGKTTLAKRVYDSVTPRFNCHAWVTVSQSYDIDEVLQSMMVEFHLMMISGSARTSGDNNVRRQMISKIRAFLKNKRYVIVFDDVWSDHFWIDIKHALVDNEVGGRIVITRRNSDVSRIHELGLDARVYVHELQPLPPEQAWKLFCNRASRFQCWKEYRPQLEDCARQIVSRCQGLPLAIVTIAGHLSTKKEVFEWKKLHDDLSVEFESNPHLTIIMRILSLSYYEMPHHLKSCFLYLGLYPIGYSINCQRLTRQWMSEGFVPFPLFAEKCLNELINRSLVQVSRVNFSGRVRECRIHDLMHVMIRKKASYLQFGNYISKEAGNVAEQTREPTRRLSIGNTSSIDVLGTMKNSRVRAVLIFNKLHKIPGSLESQFIANFKYLKLLDFEYASLTDLPEDVGTLFHLRYLSVAHTKVRQLPRSIGKLRNLETLDLRWSLVHDLPVEINRLHKLRHLLAYRIDTTTDNFLAREGGVKLKKGVRSLESLEKLYYVESNDDTMAELRKLTQLTKLGIMELKTADGRNLCEGVNGMRRLESLRASTRSEDEIIDLDSLSSPPKYLHSLFLKGRLNRFPEWIGRLGYLAKLEIVGSRLNHDPATVIHPLRDLIVLKYGDNSYDGERLDFAKGIFPNLKYLCFQHLSRLNLLVVEKGAMPDLEELSFEDCRQLREVPDGMQHLEKLKKLSLVDMPEEFTRNVKPGGQHYQIIRHVSEVVSVREVYDMPTEASTSGSH